jgi:GAF domain-containing protein/HAMP domain-containing protein
MSTPNSRSLLQPEPRDTPAKPWEIPGANQAAAQARARNAFRIAVVAVVAMTVTTLFYVYLAFHYDGWQLLALVADATVLTFTLLASAVLIRRGRVELGMELFLVVMQVTFVIDSALVTGQGWALASVTLLTVIIAPQTLPTRQSSRAIFTGVIAGAAALLVDMFELPHRLPAPEPLLVFVPIIIAVVVLIYGYSLYRQFGSYTLRAKLITAFLLVTLVPLGLLAYLNDRNSRANLTANIGSGMKALANTQALVIGNELDRQVAELHSLSQNPDLRNAAEASNAAATGTPESIQAEINKLDQQWRAADAAGNDNDPLVYSHLNNPLADRLRDFRTLLPDNVEVFITDQYGALVAATNRTSDYNQADEDWWQATYNNGQGATYIGPLEYDESSKTYASNIAVPLVAADGKTIVGVLRTTLRLKTLLDTLNVVRLGQTGRMELFIPGPQKLAGAGEKPAPVDAMTAAQIEAAAKSDYTAMTYDGVSSLVSQASVLTSNPERAAIIAQLGWVIVVHQDQSEGLAPLLMQTRGTLLLVLVMAAVVTGAAIGGAQLLSGPITRLTAAAQKVTGGDLAVQASVETGDEIGILAATFNSMTAQLRNLIGSLETRVQARTAQLSASAEVARAASSILEPRELMQKTVDLIRDRFGFYYAGIFMLDEEKHSAWLRAGTGEAGRKMLAASHKLDATLGTHSMVGWVCINKQARIALDVGQDAVRFANPLLPDTRSEIALPLQAGGRILGALDVQSEQEAAFDENDIAVLQGMADQIAVALENARLFSETQASLAENRRLVSQAQASLQEATALYEAGQAISTAPDTAAVFQAVVEHGLKPEIDLCLLVLFEDYETGNPSRLEISHVWTRAGVAPGALRAGMRFAFASFPLRGLLSADPSGVIQQQSAASEETWKGLPPDLQNIAFMPLTAGARWLGALGLGASSGLAFSQDALKPYQSLATLAAVAIENRRLIESTRASLQELSALYRRVTREAWQKALEARPALTEFEYTTDSQAAGDGNTLEMPLTLRGEEIGVVKLTSSGRPAWSEQERALVEAIVTQAALALDSARLHDETQRLAGRERLINEITARIRATTSVPDILQTAARELALALNVPHAVARISPQTNETPGSRSSPSA